MHTNKMVTFKKYILRKAKCIKKINHKKRSKKTLTKYAIHPQAPFNIVVMPSNNKKQQDNVLM